MAEAEPVRIYSKSPHTPLHMLLLLTLGKPLDFLEAPLFVPSPNMPSLSLFVYWTIFNIYKKNQTLIPHLKNMEIILFLYM